MCKYNNIVDVQGRKYVLGPTQAHFSPSVARAKMSAEKGPKHIYAEEHQLYYYYYNFEEHLVQKQEHFATSETRMTRWLRPAGSNMLEPAKMFIRARIIRHNARQSHTNECFQRGEMSLSQKQAIITLIEKKGKDRLLLKNWRPISLLKVHAKIMSKVIAARIKNALPNVIHHNQTGFIKDRYIGETVRSIFDIMELTLQENIPVLMIFIDFQ